VTVAKQVFYYALKAVVHPTAALFDAMTQTLKPLCVNALHRIFMMCDTDKVRRSMLGLSATVGPNEA